MFGQMEETVVPVGKILQRIEGRCRIKTCADGLELVSTRDVFDDEESLALVVNLLLFGHAFMRQSIQPAIVMASRIIVHSEKVGTIPATV